MDSVGFGTRPASAARLAHKHTIGDGRRVP